MQIIGGRSSAGFPSPADDYIEKSLDLNELLIKNPIATFFMRAEGDALLASGIRHGDLLIVDKSGAPAAGKTVVAVVEGQFILRKVERQDGHFVLLADDLHVEPIMAAGEDVQIWGVVRAVVHEL